MTEEQQYVINTAYHAVMDCKATPEQKLIWKFANDFNCISAWNEVLKFDPLEYAEYKQRIEDIISENITKRLPE